MIPYTTGIGIMSGTSLDGLDLAWCGFSELEGSRWDYKVLDAKTIPYPDEFRERLARATELSALEYCRLDVALGERIADEVKVIGRDILCDCGTMALRQRDRHQLLHRSPYPLLCLCADRSHQASGLGGNQLVGHLDGGWWLCPGLWP